MFGTTHIKIAWLLLCYFCLSQTVYSQNQDLEQEVESAIEKAWDLEYSNVDSAIMYANKGLEISKTHHYAKGQADSYKVLGVLHTNKAMYVLALDHHRMAKKVYEQINHLEGIAKSESNIATVQQKMGDYDQALEGYFKALKFFQSTKDSSVIGVLYINIGNNFGYQGEHKRAEENYNKALDIYTSLGAELMQARCLESIGVIKASFRQYEAARKNFDKALEVYRRADNPERLSSVLINYGFFYEEQEEYEAAIVQYKEALEIARRIEDLQSVMLAMLNLGTCYIHSEQYVQAEEVYLSTIELAKTSHAKRELAQGYLGLSELYEETGEHHKALINYRFHAQWNDSLLNDERVRVIEELNVKFDLEERNHKIELLSEENKTNLEKTKKEKVLLYSIIAILVLFGITIAIYSKNRRLRARQKQKELEQRALRVQMNPHFIFNSLNAIQDMYLSGETDYANTYMGDFSALLRKILDNSGLEKISLKDEVSTLELYLSLEKSRMGDMLSYQIDVDERIDLLNTEVPPLIIQPLVENAIWHGILPTKRAGKVSVGLKWLNDHEIACIVEDNGVGYENSVRKKNDLSHISRGVEITQSRLGKNISIETINPGTKVTLILSF